MKQILILADGLSGMDFLDRISQKRIVGNQYTVLSPNYKFELPAKKVHDMTLEHFDPTSYSKLRKVLIPNKFNMVFLLLNTPEETEESLNNIRMLDKKVQIYLLDQWDVFSKLENSFMQVFDINRLIANRLFEHLPDVPLVAQSIGLAEGEIMEVMVAFDSSFAYRHVGSISQVKWRIVAIYRDSKLILPNSATMIKPQDSILIIGKPKVLNNIYSQINNKEGMFPEPFGQDLYIILDMEHDEEEALNYINEAIYLQERLEERELIVRILNPRRFDLLERIRRFCNKDIDIQVEYGVVDMATVMTADIQNYNIGLMFISPKTFVDDKLSYVVKGMKKLIYIFGETPLSVIKKSVILMDDEESMETISSTSFYISETLGLDLCLCNYDPEGDFESKKTIIEHYETLSNVTHYPITIEQKKKNPVHAIGDMKNILQIAPLSYDVNHKAFYSLFSTKIKDHLFDSSKHPKLLIPIVHD